VIFDFIELDITQKGNLYHNLYLKIKEAAECGAIKKNEKLPSIREAAAQLGISRTTVENAYAQLCIEGIIESLPQRGYFATGAKSGNTAYTVAEKTNPPYIKYDFSSRKIDTAAADTQVWKKTVRAVLCDSGELTSYGDAQGEPGLRTALADYAFKARGVKTVPDNIIVGAGIGPLLNILCGILGRDITVGFENGGFNKAADIFADYGIKTVYLDCDSNGAKITDITKNNVNVLFLLPSALSKISVTGISKRRNEYIKWLNKDKNRIIIEDDYNGELRYTARTVPAFQGKAPDNTVYIGSFSKLLLPSVRIAYMVLPYSLAELFRKKRNSYNQTCGKIEQLALKQYISSGSLEKHLRRLRRLYYAKSQLLCADLQKNTQLIKNITLYESSITIEIETSLKAESKEICDFFLNIGIRLIESDCCGKVKLCFAGIKTEEIPQAVAELLNGFEQLSQP